MATVKEILGEEHLEMLRSAGLGRGEIIAVAKLRKKQNTFELYPYGI